MATRYRGEILYHHVTSDPTDFQVDDVLVCIEASQGLVEGTRYLALEVSRRKDGPCVRTKVVVCNETLDFVEVSEAERYLRRTRVLVEFVEPGGRVRKHSFPDVAQMDAWCTLTGVAPHRVRRVEHVVAEAMPAASCRFTAMCVPGELDDGSDGSWFVYDLLFRTSDKIGDGPQSRSLAVWMAREANRKNRDGSEPSPAAATAEVAS